MIGQHLSALQQKNAGLMSEIVPLISDINPAQS